MTPPTMEKTMISAIVQAHSDLGNSLNNDPVSIAATRKQWIGESRKLTEDRASQQ